MVSLVDGSYSVGGVSTRPSARRTARILPSRNPVRKRPMTGPTERVYPPGYSSTRSAVNVFVTVLLSGASLRDENRPSATHALDGAVAAFPVRVAQRALQQLAGGFARQLVHEVDAARPLVFSEPLAHVRHDRLPQLVVGRDAGHRLDDRLDLFAHVLVGDAE